MSPVTTFSSSVSPSRSFSSSEAFFEVGAPGSAFEGYDGQPVLIWNDRRAYDLLNELNGRGNVFNVFDTHPSRQRQNVKYSSINLANKVNIVNSVENYIHFLDGLSGEYHDKDGNLHESEMSEKIQAYRRFPLIIVIDSNKAIYDLMINKMLLNYYSDGMDYLIIHGLSAPLREIAEGLSGMPEKRRELEFLCVKEVIHWYNKILEKMKVQPQEHYDMIKKIIENQQISQYNFRVEHEAKTNQTSLVRMIKCYMNYLWNCGIVSKYFEKTFYKIELNLILIYIYTCKRYKGDSICIVVDFDIWIFPCIV